MGVMLWDKQSTNWDVGFILDLFARLTNVTKATICLPISLTNHDDLRGFVQGVQESMTEIHPFTQDMVELHYELLAGDIDSSEWVIQAATGRKSLAKLEAFYGEDARLTIDTLEQFQEIWPCTIFLSKREYAEDKKYLDWGRHYTHNEYVGERRHGKPSWT